MNFTWLFQCPNCGALILETAKNDHAEWHAKHNDPIEDLYIEIAMLPDEMMGAGLLNRWG